MSEQMYGIQIVGKGDNPIMIDHRGLVQTWADTVIENVGSGHPIIIKFYLSEEVNYVRQLKLNLRFENFRAYDKSVATRTGLTTTSPVGDHKHVVEFDIKGEATHEVAGTGSATRWTEAALTDGGIAHQHQYTIEYRHNEGYDQHWHSELEHGYAHESTESHTHNSPSHDHPIAQGIWGGSGPGNVTVELNNTDIGKIFTETVSDIKLPVDQLVHGWNTIKVSSSSLGRLSVAYFIQVFKNV